MSDRLWLSVGMLNLLGGLIALPNLQLDVSETWWVLFVSALGALNVISVLWLKRAWTVLLPLDILCAPAWLAAGSLIGRPGHSVYAGLAFAAVSASLSMLTFGRKVRENPRAERDDMPTDRLWLAAGLLNLVAGLPTLSGRLDLEHELDAWYLAVLLVGAANVVGALWLKRLWTVLLPLNLLSTPAWGAAGLFFFRSAYVGLAFAAVPVGLSLFAFIRALSRHFSARKHARFASPADQKVPR